MAEVELKVLVATVVRNGRRGDGKAGRKKAHDEDTCHVVSEPT